MQAIEFDSVVQGQTIPLPVPVVLNPGQAVRVVVMFEAKASVEDRLSTLSPHRDAISKLCESPLVLPDFLPLSRDVAHER